MPNTKEHNCYKSNDTYFFKLLLPECFPSNFENVIQKNRCVNARLHYVQENSYSEHSNKSQVKRLCLTRLQVSLKYVRLKYFSKAFELYLLQGSYSIKNILLNLYIKARIHTRMIKKNIHNLVYSSIILVLFLCVFCTRILKKDLKIVKNP